VGKGLHVMLHFKERIACLAAVDDRIERISLLTFLIDALEPRFIWHNHLYERKFGTSERYHNSSLLFNNQPGHYSKPGAAETSSVSTGFKLHQALPVSR